MTGKRSSGAATMNPSRSQNAGVRGAGRVLAAPTSGYVSTAANPRPARSSHTASTSDRREAAAAGPWVVAMQVITAGSGASGRRG